MDNNIIINKHMENLSSDSKLPKDNEVEVGIHFDMSVMTKEQINKLFQAQKLLNEIGITFDTGADGKQRDWEWDWSLKGPVHVSFRRMSKDNKKNRYARDMISKNNFPSSGQGEGLK